MPLPSQKRTARELGWSQDAEDETIRLVRLVADSEEGIMDDVFRLEYGSCEYKI